MATIKTDSHTTTLAELGVKVEHSQMAAFFAALNANSLNLSDDPKIDFRVFDYKAMAAACEAAGIKPRPWWGRTWRKLFNQLRRYR